MVVLFPGTKDQAWRWQTSNNDYGKFYMSLSREGLGAQCRADGLHAECNRKCEQLARQLCELKSELDHLKVGSQLHSPRDRDGCRDPPHHNGDCLFYEKARMPCDDMFHTTHDIEYNGGRRTEPQVLEDHLKADHPRLVKKVMPLNPIGTSSFEGIPAQPRNRQVVQIHPAPGTAHSDDRMNNLYRRPESAGSGGVQARGQMVDSPGGQVMDNEYQQTGSGGHSSPRGGRVPHRQYGGTPVEPDRLTPKSHYGRSHGYSGGRPGDGGSRERTLPPSQRYNFYRYYGFAGQGAKTSRGWNPK